MKISWGNRWFAKFIHHGKNRRIFVIGIKKAIAILRQCGADMGGAREEIQGEAENHIPHKMEGSLHQSEISLIRKLRSIRYAPGEIPNWQTENKWIDECIAIIRQHEADMAVDEANKIENRIAYCERARKGLSSEISVVDEIRTIIESSTSIEFKLVQLLPYLRATEPVLVDLGIRVRQWLTAFKEQNENDAGLSFFDAQEQIEHLDAILDAAGVKYVD